MRTKALWKKLSLVAAATCVVAGLGLLTLDARREGAAPPAAQQLGNRVQPAPSPPVSPLPALAQQAAGAQAPSDSQVPQLPAGSEYRVDLAKLRGQLPDNRYWRDAAPTDEPALLREREEAAQRWNSLFGKVQAGEATEAEVREYYAYRRQLSEDYIALSLQILENGGEQLAEREQALHQLNIQLHRARLADLPGQERDALARREAQEQRRQAWLRGGGGGP